MILNIFKKNFSLGFFFFLKNSTLIFKFCLNFSQRNRIFKDSILVAHTIMIKF